MRRIFKNRKGFSLAEVMIVVAILGVLFGLGAVEVVKYKKKIKQLHYDSYGPSTMKMIIGSNTYYLEYEGNSPDRKLAVNQSSSSVVALYGTEYQKIPMIY